MRDDNETQGYIRINCFFFDIKMVQIKSEVDRDARKRERK